MPKKILTQEDLDNNPELAELGLKPGDEIEIPEENTVTDDPATDDDGGGGNHPTDPSGKP